MLQTPLQTVGIIGSYVPRQCGIATFAKNVHDAVQSDGKVRGIVVALDDQDEGYEYPPEVRFEVRASHVTDYDLAAEFLNVNQIDVALLQHEFGLYGPRAGDHILAMISELDMPLITTLHTVLPRPNHEQAAVMAKLSEHSDRFVVMSRHGAGILENVYGVSREKIAVIPHGIPEMNLSDTLAQKKRFRFGNRRILMTFGLLSPGKGLEVVIRALPEVIKTHPELLYVIVGALHPNIRKRDGNAYLHDLQRLTEQLGVSDHVAFHTRYVEKEELIAYLGAADMFVTPYPDPDQAVSGTLTYAMGAGNAVLSTPYAYAREMLADDRGVLFDFNDVKQLSAALLDLLDHPDRRDQIRNNAYRHTRPFVWDEVGHSYRELCRDVIEERHACPRTRAIRTSATAVAATLPEIKLDHLIAMTDDTGVFQHALYTVPDRKHGYCSDDNARALIAACLYRELTDEPTLDRVASTGLSFIQFAWQPERRSFLNFMTYDRRWVHEDKPAEDCYGRCMWALGIAVAYGPNVGFRALATRLFSEALPVSEQVTSPRTWAFTLVGIHAYLRRYSGDVWVRQTRETLARRLFDQFEQHGTSDWPWCEDVVTYANAKLPHALLLSGKWMPDGRMTEMGLRALDWLIRIQTDESGQLSLIGNRGWMARGSAPPRFDQQPIDAMAIVEACAEAARITGDAYWHRKARWAMEWFLGGNCRNASLYDSATGGCRDGLHAGGTNLNEGAESTLAWLISLMTLHGLRRESLTGIAGAREPDPVTTPAEAP